MPNNPPTSSLLIVKTSSLATKTALTFSLCLMILWTLLGAGTSLAWFMDETEPVKNTFDIGILDLEVYHKKGDTYVKVDSDESIFDDEAIYEPGYTQIVRLKIENKGTVEFDYKMSVIPGKVVTAKNIYGSNIYLPNHLKFGVIVADTEAALEANIAERNIAREYATMPLSNYYSSVANGYIPEKNYTTDGAFRLNAEKTNYVAVIVWMPETVGNEANHRDDHAPQVELGINVKAMQVGTPQ